MTVELFDSISFSSETIKTLTCWAFCQVGPAITFMHIENGLMTEPKTAVLSITVSPIHLSPLYTVSEHSQTVYQQLYVV